MLLRWERNCISMRRLGFCLLDSLLFLYRAREVFKGPPFYILCRNLSSLIIKRESLQLHSLITSRLKILVMVDFVESDQKERQRQMLFVATTDKMYTHRFLIKAMLACDRRRENTTPHPVRRGIYLLFLLAQPEVWSDWLPLLRYAFGEKGLPFFHTSYP